MSNYWPAIQTCVMLRRVESQGKTFNECTDLVPENSGEPWEGGAETD